MKMLRLITVLIFTSLLSTPAMAQNGAQTPLEMKRVMYNLLYQIEQATGLEHRASSAINNLDEDGRQLLFDSISDKKQFTKSARAAMRGIDTAQAPTGEAVPKLESGLSYSPDYPVTAAYLFAQALGLTSSPDQRCGGDGLENYRSFLTGFEEGFYAAEALCVVAGCDPTGIVCATACIPFETVGVALHYAKLPIAACEVHEGNVNAAEIEAGFENTVSLLTDVDALATDLDGLETRLANHNNLLIYHDDRLYNHDNRLTAHDNRLVSHDNHLTAHDGNLAAHDSHLADHEIQLGTHDADIKALLTTVLGNQQEVIKLLKTPQGKRPGWRKEGYK